MGNLGLTQLSASQNNKETTVNDITDELDLALSDVFSTLVDDSDARTLTAIEWTQAQQFSIEDDSPAPTGVIVLTVPGTTKAIFSVFNQTSFTVTVTVAGQPVAAPTVPSGDILVLTSDGINVRALSGGSGASDFLGLTDTPFSFAGQAGLAAVVNAGESALEFAAVAAGGVGGGGTNVAVTPAFRGALVTNSTNTVNISGGVLLNWDTESFDTDNFHDTITNNSRFTIPAGVTKVTVQAQIALSDFTVNAETFLNFRLNGVNLSPPVQSTYKDDSTGGFNNRVYQLKSYVIDVVGGDFLEIRVNVSSATNDDVNSADSWFAIEVVETSDSQQLPTAFIAVQPKFTGALVNRSSSFVTSSNNEVIDWQTETYNVGFQPGDTGGTQRFWLGVDQTFVDGDVTIGTDVVAETAHGFITGEGPIRLTSSGTLPAGLSLATDYWIIADDADGIAFATSRANALADTRVDITAAAGGGTHTMNTATKFIVPAGVSRIRILAGLDTATDSDANSSLLFITKNDFGVATFPGIVLSSVDANETGSKGIQVTTPVLEVVEGDTFETAINITPDLDANAQTFYAIEVVETSNPLSFPGITVERPHIGVQVQLDADLLSQDTTSGLNIPWESATFDTGYRGISFAEFTTNPSRVTIPAGITRVRLGGSFRVLNYTGATTGIRLVKNGSIDFQDGSGNIVGSSGFSDGIASLSSGIIDVVETDFFELQMLGQTDTSVDFDASRSNFWLEVVETQDAAQPPEQVETALLADGASLGVNSIEYKKIAVRRFSLFNDFANSQAHAGTAPTVTTQVFDVKRNGTTIGTVTFGIGSQTATFLTLGGGQEDFEIGDQLTIETSGTVNTIIADIAISLWAFRT